MITSAQACKQTANPHGDSVAVTRRVPSLRLV